MQPIVVILLHLALWSTAHALFETAYKCNPDIVKKLNDLKAKRLYPSVLKELEKDKPWAVDISTNGMFPENTKSVVINGKTITAILDEGNSSEANLPEREEAGLLIEDAVTWHVLRCETQVFAFVICKNEGPEGPPLAAIAVSVKSPGGITDEAKEIVQASKEELASLNIDLEAGYNININT